MQIVGRARLMRRIATAAPATVFRAFSLLLLVMLGTQASFAQVRLACSSSAPTGKLPSTSGTTPCSNSDSGQTSWQASTTVQDQGGSFQAVFSQAASGAAQASASLLQVQASASADASTSPAVYEYTDIAGNGAAIDNHEIVGANSQGISVASDTFTAKGPGAVGTLQYRISIVVSGTPTSSECVSQKNDGGIIADLYTSGIDTHLANGTPGLQYQSSACSGIDYDVSTGIVTTTHNSNFSITLSLTAYANSYAGYPPPPINVPFVENGTTTSNAGLIVFS